MSTFLQITQICAVCKHKSSATIVASTNAFGAPDLDMRPPEMRRSTMHFWVSTCPKCGYTASDIEKLPEKKEMPAPRKKKRGWLDMLADEAAKTEAEEYSVRTDFRITKKWLSGEEYLSCEGIPFTDELAKQFYRQYLILKKSGLFEEALYAARNAAWACDDAWDIKNAEICRKKSVEMIDAVLENAPHKEELEVLKTDLLRRSGEFERLLREYGGKHYENELHAKIVAFELEKAAARDSECYTVDDI